MKKVKYIIASVAKYIVASPLLLALWFTEAGEALDAYMRRAKWPERLFARAERIEEWGDL